MENFDLECCGNCKNRTAIDMGDYHAEDCDKGKMTESCQICNEWEHDGLNRDCRILTEDTI